ncbi:MAG: sigma 54-interacting transcriptional regulator, partial [Desulfomonilaceae bacterium]
MSRDTITGDKSPGLRMKAEQTLRGSSPEAEDLDGLSQEDVRKLIHELKVHQIELEMQNEELRLTSLELEESRANYFDLYNFAPSGYFTLDRKGLILEANLTGAALLGADRKSLMGKPFFLFVSKDGRNAFFSHQKEAAESQDSTSCEIELAKNNGDRLYARLESVAGKDGRLQMIVSDVTRRKNAEDALRHNEERLRAIFESVQDFIFLMDTSLRITHVNPAVEKLLNKPASELLGMRAEEIVDRDSSEYVRGVGTRVLQGESIDLEHVIRIGGVPITFHAFLVPLHDAVGKIAGVCGVAQDITDRTKREFSSPKLADEYPSAAMRATLNKARLVAKGNSTVLLLGESGSGKDYVAKYIHDHSKRADGLYYSVNCASIVPELAESELFGHEKGSFTGAYARKRGLLELAEGGTLLLNEIGELSLQLQAKLLTFLDTRHLTRVGGEKNIPVNARLLAATNKDLEKEAEAGRFRKDLLYRLDVMSIVIPPLRERIEDIPVLVREIMGRLQADLQLHELPAIDAATMNRLQSYRWPGNVRELRNVLERGLILSDRRGIHLAGLPGDVNSGDWSFTTKFPAGRTLNDVTYDLKQSLVVEALRRSRGRRQAAARLLGISRDS